MRQLKSGFTLIEVSLVIVLIAIIIAITTPLAIDAVIKADLNAAYESLYGSLLRAQNLSRIQERGQQWSLCIDSANKNYTIAAGSCSSPVYKETIQFASHITITASPSSNVVFSSVTGNPTNNSSNSSFNFTLSSRGVSKSMGINKSGVIDKAATTSTSPPSTTSIVTNGLVLNLDASNIASYPGTGSTWTSLVGTKNATLSTNITYSSNNGGYFIVPNGSEKITLTKDSAILDFPADFTIDTWFMLTSTPSSIYPSAVFSSWNGVVGDLDSRFIVYVGSTGAVTAELKGQSQPVTHQTTLSINTWYNLTLIRQSNVFRLYLNTVASTASSTSTLALSPTLDTWIGNYTSSNGNSTKGRIGSFKVYNNRALTDLEIQQNYNATKSRFGL